jgi:quinol monooxygenase YgiN
MSLRAASGHITMTPQVPPEEALDAGTATAPGSGNAQMVIVAGHVTVEPQQRESYLAGCIAIVEQAREAAGCLDIAITADLVDPGRVDIFERWESRAALEAFRRSGPPFEQAAMILSVSAAEYDVVDARPLFDRTHQEGATP